jgi:hypothetical protein
MQEIQQEENRIPLPAKASSSLRFLIYGDVHASSWFDLSNPTAEHGQKGIAIENVSLKFKRIMLYGSDESGAGRLIPPPNPSERFTPPPGLPEQETESSER